VFLLGGAGFLLAGLWDSPRLPTVVKWLALALVLGGQLRLYYVDYGPYQRRQLPSPPGLAAVMRTVMPPEDFAVIYGWDWNALLPYYAERRVIMVPRGREADTAVLDDILRPLPPARITALIIRQGDMLRTTPEFIRERLNRFRLAPTPFASSDDGDLYLADELVPAAAARLADRTFAGVTLHREPPPDPFAGQLHEVDLAALDLPMTTPRPIRALGLLGINVGSDHGRNVILAHPVSELYFRPPDGATQIDAGFGLADGAYAQENPAPTDGVTVEIVERRPDGRQRTLFRRDLDPAHELADRGVQTVHLDGFAPFSGTIVFRLTPGTKDNLASDWAYWSSITIH